MLAQAKTSEEDSQVDTTNLEEQLVLDSKQHKEFSARDSDDAVTLVHTCGWGQGFGCDCTYHILPCSCQDSMFHTCFHYILEGTKAFNAFDKVRSMLDRWFCKLHGFDDDSEDLHIY